MYIPFYIYYLCLYSCLKPMSTFRLSLDNNEYKYTKQLTNPFLIKRLLLYKYYIFLS